LVLRKRPETGRKQTGGPQQSDRYQRGEVSFGWKKRGWKGV